MAFTRANPLGWALYEVLTSAQMNALDIDHANAIDGAAGGSYTPSGLITIDGGPVAFGTGALVAEPSTGEVVFQDGFVDIAAQSYTRVYPFVHAQLLEHFTYGSTYVYQSSVAGVGAAEITFAASPRVGTLTSIALSVKGAGGHGGLPGTMPNISIYREVPGAGGSTLLGTQSDTSASTGAYETLHTITVAGLTEALTQTNLYRLVVLGETGANAATGLLVYSFSTTITAARAYP
jgi:hypothetical protein